MRIGHGFDVHAFGDDSPLIICGVHVPYTKGLLAYSDGDVALHALIDSLLGAAALGDIGQLFPDTNEDYKGVDSRALLRKAMHKIAKENYQVGNVDITIIAQAPKIMPYKTQMRTNIAEDLSVDIHKISIKATTTEKLGFIGRVEGIACEAVTLLIKASS